MPNQLPQSAGRPARPARWRALTSAAALVAVSMLGGSLAEATPLPAQQPVAVPTGGSAKAVGVHSSKAKPKTKAVSSKRSVNLGVRFTTSSDGTVTALQFYRSKKQKKAYVASLWGPDGKLLARATFSKSTKVGWQTVSLSEPVAVQKGKTYTASYLASDGRFAATRGYYAKKRTSSGITVAKKGGVFTNSKKSKRPKKKTTSSYLVDVVFTPNTGADVSPPAKPSPAPSPTTPSRPSQPSSGWPSTSNTGVPAGETLTDYTGPRTITANGTEIRNKIVNGTLTIEASDVKIVNTRINGEVLLRDPKSSNYSFTITDSEVHIQDPGATGIMMGNFHATRVEVTGGRRSIYCKYNCVVEDSLVHKQSSGAGNSDHFSGIRMEQNGTFRHNTLICEAASRGCSASLTGYGDFAPVQNNLIENNLFIGDLGGQASMCAYGGSSGANGDKPYGDQARDIRFINNVFTKGATGRCGKNGAVAHFDASRPGNQWSGNVWDDGTPLS